LNILTYFSQKKKHSFHVHILNVLLIGSC